MLGDFIYSADVDNAGYRDAAPQKFEKAVWRFLVLAVVFVCGGLIWIFCISPCMVPVKADVKSFSGLDKADVLRIAGIGGAATYISVDAERAEARLMSYPLVESARVIKHFPDRLSIFVEPRRMVAMTLARVNGRVLPLCIDRYGYAYKIGNNLNEMAPSLMPVVSGVLDEGTAIQLGQQVPSAYLPLFSRIGAISDADSRIWQAISEIRIAKKDNGMYDLILYPVNDSIRLRMRSDINKDSIYYALLIYDVYRQSKNGVPYEIDVRSGFGVVSAKEARFGK